MWVAFANAKQMQKLLTFFLAKIFSIYAIFNEQSFNDTLTNNIVSFEQLGQGLWILYNISRNREGSE